MKLENFKILKKIGLTLTGEIYLVINKIDNLQYVIKIVKVKDINKQIREINILKKIKLKYIIELKDYLINENKFYLWMKYYPNGDLYKLLKREKNLSESFVLKIVYKIIKSVRFIHGNNIIHRDIKPENILIDNNYNPILIDFGFSSDNIHTLRNTFCGTFEYMAPEIFLGKHQDKYTDIWSIGILLYEIFYKKSPFYGKNFIEIKNNILNKTPIFDNKLVNKEINLLISQILNKDPCKRINIHQILLNKLFSQFKKLKKKKQPNSSTLRKIKSPLKFFINIKKNYLIPKNKKENKLSDFNSTSLKTKETNLNNPLQNKEKSTFKSFRRKKKKSILNPSKDKSNFKNNSIYSNSNINNNLKNNINNINTNNIISNKKFLLSKLKNKIFLTQKNNNILKYNFKN